MARGVRVQLTLRLRSSDFRRYDGKMLGKLMEDLPLAKRDGRFYDATGHTTMMGTLSRRLPSRRVMSEPRVVITVALSGTVGPLGLRREIIPAATEFVAVLANFFVLMRPRPGFNS
jgi:hypothetical protein